MRPPLSVEVHTVVSLAVPVVLAELGWMAMNVVDTVMVGDLGPAAIGAIAVGGSVFYTFAIFCLGLMLGLDTLVSQAFGAGNRIEARRSLSSALALALVLGSLLTLLFWLFPDVFGAAHIDESVRPLATEFLRALGFSSLPLLLYGAFRRYLQATSNPGPVTIALVSANLINWGGNWLLIQGHLGFPALGVRGSALSTVLARIYMACVLGIAVFLEERRRDRQGDSPGWRGVSSPHVPFWRLVSLGRIGTLLRVGSPAAVQILMELGAFGATTLLAGTLSAVAVAAHQIALNLASIAFMVPLGISSAAAVLVGQAIGRGDRAQTRHHGNIALWLTGGFELCTAALFFTLPQTLLRAYTGDAEILRLATTLLRYAAAFQLFDGLQTVATGALRGLGNTKLPMLMNFAGYWVFGLPVGWILCFRAGQGVAGLWCGLTIALVLIAIVLTWTWNRDSKNFLMPFVR